MYSIVLFLIFFLLSSTLALFAARMFFLLFNYKYLSRCIVGTVLHYWTLQQAALDRPQSSFFYDYRMWRQDLYSCFARKKNGRVVNEHLGWNQPLSTMFKVFTCFQIAYCLFKRKNMLLVWKAGWWVVQACCCYYLRICIKYQ